jgi:hypothetical protein
MSKFINSDIVFWSLDFDGDGYSYIHHKVDNVLNAIKEFADIEMAQFDDDEDNKNKIISKILEDCLGVIDGSGPSSNVILVISNKMISVRRMTFDKHNVIHKILSEVYSVVDEPLQKRIESVFQHSS